MAVPEHRNTRSAGCSSGGAGSHTEQCFAIQHTCFGPSASCSAVASARVPSTRKALPIPLSEAGWACATRTEVLTCCPASRDCSMSLPV